MTFKPGQPTDEELQILALHIVTFWKRLGRVLKIENYTLDAIEANIPQVYEQSLEMLSTWQRLSGSLATYRVLGEALVHQCVDRPDLEAMTCRESVCASHQEDPKTHETLAAEIEHLSIEEDLGRITYPKNIPSVSILLGEPFHKTFQREKELRALQERFDTLVQDNKRDDVSMVYVTGPPGSGKTQLSRSYSFKWYSQWSLQNKSCSTVVATLHAETPESLLESYVELARALGIKTDDVGKYDDVKKRLKFYSKAIRHLFQNSKLFNFEWLVVVDNVFEQDPLKEFWPLPGNGWGNGHVIVTTQDSQLAPSAHTHSRTLSLSKGMDKDDAIDFLCLIAELDRDEYCDVVAQKLDYYPLSLACAAVFVKDMRHNRPAANFSWKNYLENLEKYFEFLGYSQYTDHNICYPRSMLPAVFCCANRMAENSQVLKFAFKFLSFCTIQPVPLDLVSEAVLKNIKDEVLIPDEVKATLASCSLLTYPEHGVRGIEVVTMHQVVRAAFIRLRKESSCKSLTDDERKAAVREFDGTNFIEALETLCQYYRQFQIIEEHAISTRILLSPHLQDFVNEAKTQNLTHNEAFIDVSVCFADSLIHVAGGTDHERVKLLEAAQRIQQELHLQTVCAYRLLIGLGYTYREAGRLDDVIPVLEEANDIAKNNYEDLQLMKERSKLLNILGWTYRETFQLDLAAEYMSMSVNIAKKAFGEQHAEVIERLCNLGIILNDSWKNKEAIEVMEDAQTIVEALGIDTQSAVRAQVANYTAKICLRWYLGLYYSEGLTEKASELLARSRTLHETALNIYENLHGIEHKFYQGTAMTYATVLCHVGEADLAIEHCQEALRVCRSSGHLSWPRVASILADIYLEKGMFSTAKNLLEEAIRGLEEFGLDKGNPRYWLPHARLAEAMINTGEKARAVDLLQKCLRVWSDNGISEEHFWVVRARKALKSTS